MPQLSDLSRLTFDRAIRALEGQVPKDLVDEIRALVASGDIADGKKVAAAIARASEMEAPGAD